MSNTQCYERFNTKVNVSTAIGVTLQHTVLLEFVAQELHASPFTTITPLELEAACINTERYLSYYFLRRNSAQHNKLKVDLQIYFTTGKNHYTNIRQKTLCLLDKYSKTVTPKQSAYEGTSFVQRGDGVRGRGEKNHNKSNNQQPFDK